MVNIIVDYLRDKAKSLEFVAEAYGLAELVERISSQESVSFPAVYQKGELTQVNFDAHPSLVFFILDGEVERETDDGEITSCSDQVTETYQLKLFFFNAGKEISNCASFAQQEAYSIAKYLTADNSQLQTNLQLQELRIAATSLNFSKKDVWEELHSNIPFSLSEQQQLCRISFEVLVSGVESCFVTDPCDNSEFVYEFPIVSFCERVDDCLGIDRENGDATKVLNERGDFVQQTGGGGGAVDSVNGQTGDVVLDADDIGLGNVDNTSDANKPVSTAQAAADAVVLTTAQSYADALVVGLWDDRGNYDASGNVFPSSGGSGTAGAIVKGDIWTISVAGTLGGVPVATRQTVRALVDTPGQTAANWAIGLANTDIEDSITDGVTGRAPSQNAVYDALQQKQNSLGFTPEDVSNKKTSLTDNSDTFYPSQKAVKTAVDAKQDTLVSGTNIKTVNGESLLGSGNVDIAAANILAIQIFM